MSSTEHKRDEDMSRAYHAASHGDPPAALDDAIRAAARRAVHARPHTAKNPWLPRWGSPIAAAAVVMLAVSMLFVAVDERPEIAPPALQVSLPKNPPPAVQLPATESGPADARDKAVVATATSGRIEEKPPAATTTVMAKAVPTPSKTTAAQQSPSAISSSAGFEARRDAAAPMRESAIIVAPENLAKPAPAAAFPAAPLATPAAPPPQFVAGQMAERARDEAVQLNQESKRMMAKSAALASGTAATREMRQDVNKKDASDTTIVSTQSMAPSAYAPPAAAPAQEPNAWLKRIEELRVQGKLKEAREELARFRKQYPKIELPKALAEMPAE